MVRQDEYDPDELFREEYEELDPEKDDEEEGLFLGEGRAMLEYDDDGAPLNE